MSDSTAATSIDEGAEAAWHGAPADGIRLLGGALDSTDPEAAARARWLLAVCLGALGRYGEGLAVLDGASDLSDARWASGAAGARWASESAGARWASLSASTAGSWQRQLGRHAAGREHDVVALHLAGDDAEAAVDARLGLAADAVGTGDVATAQEEWAHAVRIARATWPGTGLVEGGRPEVGHPQEQGDEATRPAGWRSWVRVRWVEAEIALLRGDPAAAVAPALAAVEISRLAAAPRHEAKSRMFAGVGLWESGGVRARRAAGRAHLRLSLEASVHLGLDPLVRPVGAYLGHRVECHGPQTAQSARRSARASRLSEEASERISTGLPESLRHLWDTSW